MAAYDSIVNVEEWISDHYLTTDETKGGSFSKRVSDQVRDWKKEETETGQDSPWSRFQAHRLSLQTALATLDSETSRDTACDLVRAALGYGPPTTLSTHRASETTTYSGWSGNAGSMVVIAAEPLSLIHI